MTKESPLLCLLISWSSLEARTWTDIQGREIEADYLSQNDKSVVLKLENGKEAVVPFARLSKADLAFLEERKAEERSGKKQAPKISPIPKDLPKRYYPMSLVELQNGLAEILERPAKGSFPPDQTEALNLLNAYRFLCGVEPEVTLDRSMFEGAMKAAAACQKFGDLSHDLGEHTESCNLHQNSGTSTIAWSVTRYIEDNGANNRDARGHRR